MTGTFCTGWDRTDDREWSLPPGRLTRWMLVWRFKKEMRHL